MGYFLKKEVEIFSAWFMLCIQVYRSSILQLYVVYTLSRSCFFPDIPCYLYSSKTDFLAVQFSVEQSLAFPPSSSFRFAHFSWIFHFAFNGRAFKNLQGCSLYWLPRLPTPFRTISEPFYPACSCTPSISSLSRWNTVRSSPRRRIPRARPNSNISVASFSTLPQLPLCLTAFLGGLGTFSPFSHSTWGPATEITRCRRFVSAASAGVSPGFAREKRDGVFLPALRSGLVSSVVSMSLSCPFTAAGLFRWLLWLLRGVKAAAAPGKTAGGSIIAVERVLGADSWERTAIKISSQPSDK